VGGKGGVYVYVRVGFFGGLFEYADFCCSVEMEQLQRDWIAGSEYLDHYYLQLSPTHPIQSITNLRPGLVQWVENTVPMADYLAGRQRNGGAHARWVGGRRGVAIDVFGCGWVYGGRGDGGSVHLIAWKLQPLTPQSPVTFTQPIRTLKNHTKPTPTPTPIHHNIPRLCSYKTRTGWTWFDCYHKIAKAPPEQLLPNFLQCLANFPPVFHHFFLEAFRAPAAWFEARTRYTRSIAVSSMAGYVIGLGEWFGIGCAWLWGGGLGGVV